MAWWRSGRIVSFFQDRASKTETKVVKYGTNHGGAIWGTAKSEGRPTDKAGKTIPPPPTYVIPPPAAYRVTPTRAHADTDSGRDFAGGPNYSFPEMPGLINRYQRRFLYEERIVQREERPPPMTPRWSIGSLFATPWSPWERHDPPGTRDRRDDDPGGGWGGPGRGYDPGPPSPPGDPPPGYTSW